MPISKEEAQEAIELYDIAMTGNIEALCKVLELYTKATCGDYNAEGLVWAISSEMERRSRKPSSKHPNKKSKGDIPQNDTK